MRLQQLAKRGPLVAVLLVMSNGAAWCAVGALAAFFSHGIAAAAGGAAAAAAGWGLRNSVDIAEIALGELPTL